MSDQDDNKKGLFPKASMLPKVVTKAGIPVPLRKIVVIDPESLIDAYESQTPWVAVLQYEYGIAELDLDRIERKIKEKEADAYLNTRRRLSIGSKAPNEATIKASVTSSQEICELYEEMFAIKERLAGLKAARDAMSTRQHMLISMGAEVRLDKRSI